MNKLKKCTELLRNNSRRIPGGISSANRAIDPPVAFARADGAYLWDQDGNRYIDYHAAFGPYFLGHNFRPVQEAVLGALGGGESLFGAGPSASEGRLAEIVCANVAGVDQVVILNTGSEATSLAVRMARAYTGKSHYIVVQGGYNGNHDELACNVVNSIDEIGPRVCPGEYPVVPLGAGTTVASDGYVHVVNFNDLDSVEFVCQRHPIGGMILEPILQNIGVVKPKPGYLAGLRRLADKYGFVLIFDEVKTGFRHAVGGMAEIAGVRPDLVVYGKAIANGFPLALVGGSRDVMGILCHADPRRRPFVAGTYNGHPVPVSAAIATLEYLVSNRDSIYSGVDKLGRMLAEGLATAFQGAGLNVSVARQGSALSYYFTEAPPADFHDILVNHDANRDTQIRRELVRNGVFIVPIATKQISVSTAHSVEDIETTVDVLGRVLRDA